MIKAKTTWLPGTSAPSASPFFQLLPATSSLYSRPRRVCYFKFFGVSSSRHQVSALSFPPEAEKDRPQPVEYQQLIYSKAMLLASLGRF